MNVIVIASIVIVLTLLFGVLIAVLVRVFSRAVNQEQVAMEVERNSYNPGLSLGYSIPVADDYNKQLKAAQELAAERAARTPRGGNLGIGLADNDKQLTAFDGLNEDPVSAVKIAQYHGWAGVQTGAMTASSAAVEAKAPTQTAASAKGAADLVPGEDYPLVEITDDMSPAEKRKARIANAKAKSAAVKAWKQTASPTPEATTSDSPDAVMDQSPAAIQPAAESATFIATAREPVPGVDYEVIEITEDMPPDEIRKARIANIKAKSAAMKTFKAAGGETAASAPVQEVLQVVDSASQPDPVVEVEDASSADQPAASLIPADIPKPDYIEIAGDLDPAELRKARIHNAKERAAYNKALKAAGIDPASVT